MCAARHRPSRSKILSPTFCLVGVMIIWSRSSWLRRPRRSCIDPPSLVRRHVKWKMARTKKTGEMTTEATKEIAEKIVSHFQLTITIMFEYFENAMYHCVFSVQNSFEEQPHRDRSSPMDVRMFWPLLLDVQSTLDVSVPARGVHHRESDEAGHGILQPA